jgi:hypothetical protein
MVSIVVTIDSFGTSQMASTDEQNLVESYPQLIEYKNLTFSRKLNIDSTTNNIIEDVTNGDLVTIPLIIDEKIVLSSLFTASFIVNIDEIKSSQYTTIFNTGDKLARAYREVFRLVIKDAISSVMATLRSKYCADAETSYTELI